MKNEQSLSRINPKNLKIIDHFKHNEHYYEAYLLVNGKVMLIDEDGGIIFFGDIDEYIHYKEKHILKVQ